MRLTSLALVLLAAAAGAAEHRIKPGEDPQAVLDAAAPGDKLAFLPGLHQHGLKKHRSILYVDKSVEIELMAGATLKLADGVCRKESIGEITTDQDSGKKLDDLEVGGAFDLRKGKVEGSELFGSTVYTLIVTGGKDGAPVALTPSEFKILEALVAHPGQALSRMQLLDIISIGDDAPSSRMIDVFITGLRRKLERNKNRPELITTVRGYGYRFDGKFR